MDTDIGGIQCRHHLADGQVDLCGEVSDAAMTALMQCCDPPGDLVWPYFWQVPVTYDGHDACTRTSMERSSHGRFVGDADAASALAPLVSAITQQS
jgi:hypothetical protein